MLHVKDIQKYYEIAGQKYWALKGVNLSFRQNEFVAILGQSGSGKTTLLNIIGGLDRYSAGDLIIDDVSTKSYKDKDWDAYRNHRIGFVFQSYNLIPHLDVLSNVELALTLSGVTAKERKKRALDVLTTVGLKDHVTKKPTQLSGGQQQRVAIARALINDPNIILADEPTGALDTETSVEIMELLTSISKDKLIIMVTHNPEIANKYAKRIISLKDGKVTSDTNPYTVKEEAVKEVKEKTSMSFITALKLSFKNLLTKKFRTLLTAFAGSIGIIGVGLVLALQFGFTSYLSEMERGTFAGLPLQVSTTFLDIGQMMNPDNTNQGPTVEDGFIGRDPNNNFQGTNIIDQEFIDFLLANNITDYADLVKVFGFDINAFNLVGDTLLSSPRTPGSMLNPTGNALISEALYSEQFLADFTDTLARYTGDYQFGASLVINSSNAVPNALLPFFGLPQSTPLEFEDILGKTFKIYTNDILFTQNPANGRFSRRSTADLLTDFNSGSDYLIEVTITKVIQSNTQFVNLSTGIMLDHQTSSAIHTANLVSELAIAQQASSTIILDGMMPPNLTVNQVLINIGGSENPDMILLYPNNFDAKEQVIAIIDAYNATQVDPERHITAVDQTAMALNMMRTILDSISAVLIAFASISLFVSSIMIGIITYTSVLERTKEIGVLRSIGARKKDISRVFNAEAILVGFTAGVLGVLVTFALVPLINVFLRQATDGHNVAELFIGHAAALVAISIGLTFIAGLIPSRIAANKDPVVALRSE